MRVITMLGGAALFGALVWLSVGAEILDLAQAAWWAPLVVLVTPAFFGALYLFERRRGY